MTEKKNILIICHSAAGQMYLGVLLGRFWYTPLLARTTEEAIRLTQKKNCSLIVLDGDLPDRERKMAISLLKSHAAVRDLPLIVFITTENAAENKTLLAEGCSAVITKPVDLALLYGTISGLTGLAAQLTTHFRKIPRCHRRRNPRKGAHLHQPVRGRPLPAHP